jgi:hypothetical protein
MNQLFDDIYESLSLARLPGIVSFESITGRALTDMIPANDAFFGEQNYDESFAGGSLDQD